MKLVDAFVALGGQTDQTGYIDNSKFVSVVKDDFGMTINLAKLIVDLDLDADGRISYTEFHALFV